MVTAAMKLRHLLLGRKTMRNLDSIFNKAEIDVFLELPCFSYDPADVGNLVSGSSVFSETSLNIWKFMIEAVILEPYKIKFVTLSIVSPSICHEVMEPNARIVIF